ncbi:gluconolactonase [Hoeflea marina]|uniref:Gluconolactonase n=1 Tax=Hoeflea marina TaxID=274592 RepID=A0A317PKT3_9HYPH|nr:SMP-30/gluconolactonase/LRE family protein [Hoeflea marina]PWV99209.1 gluconolactonase [Hoeflea marina]
MADEDFEIFDARFNSRVKTSARLDHLFDDCRWAEGPAYFPAHRQLVWSDIPNNRMLRYDETSGGVSEFRNPSNFSNGHTVDRQGRLVSCEHGARRVSRTEPDGSITVIADRFEGKRLNSPNDVVVRSDGSIWFTDPTYGIDSDYEGHRADSEIGASLVFRVDPQSGEIRKVADDFTQPNGLAFSPDETKLYIADTGATHVPGHPRHIRVFDVGADGVSLGGGAEFCESTNGLFDGFRFDRDGYLWTSAGNGVHCYAPEGRLVGVILTPERVANVCFGGPRRNRLYICATTSLYAMTLPVIGARTF